MSSRKLVQQSPMTGFGQAGMRTNAPSSAAMDVNVDTGMNFDYLPGATNSDFQSDLGSIQIDTRFMEPGLIAGDMNMIIGYTLAEQCFPTC